MKKLLIAILSSVTALSAVSSFFAASAQEISYNYSYDVDFGYDKNEQITRRMENLDRGLKAVKTTDGVYLSWRLLDSEDAVYGSADSDISFDIYRDGNKIATEANTTNYTDAQGTAKSKYIVARSGESITNSVNIGSDGDFTVNATELGLKAYAVKYENNALSGVKVFDIDALGENTLHSDFVPDDVLLWKDMQPAEGRIGGEVSVLSKNYFDIPLVKPEAETVSYSYIDGDGNTVNGSNTYSFFPADCSCGDVDGDGEYEIIVKWTSSERDVGSPGDPAFSGTVRFAAYKLDGTKLWDNDINLGKNVYSSAHTVQFLVYDFDGDGKAEMMCQTSLGSTDGVGSYVSKCSSEAKIASITDESNETADFRGYGRITTGEEFLTVFNGETGEAIDTITLPTSRGGSNGAQYGDDFGNRSNRFLANVAYLDGEKPYAVYQRGYYFGRNGKQRTSIAGVSFDGEKLSADYRFDTQKNQPGYYAGAEIYVGQGNHNCTVADVDNDGKDEYITGALCMEVNDENQFRPRWCTFMEHGDALHIGDYDPTHKGLEFFTVHEDAGPNTLSGETVEINFGMSVIDADTGEIILHMPNSKDTGRGCMANIGSGGYYQITGVGNYQCNGGTDFTPTSLGAGSNFRIFWDGDLYDELLDGTTVSNLAGNKMQTDFTATGCVQINGTKANPALQADLFGDWREELVYPTKNGSKLRVFMTTSPTAYKIKTLMHDPVYRSGVAAEQTAYNQPPHVGFYMDDEVFEQTGNPVSIESIEITSQPEVISYLLGEKLDTTGLKVTATLSNGETKEIKSYSVSGYNPDTEGEQTITVTSKDKTDEFTVNVFRAKRISVINSPLEIMQNRSIKKSDLTVWAFFGDGGAYKEIGDYEVVCNTKEVGAQTATVTYGDLEATFDIEVIESDISALNQTYETDSTASVLTEAEIGDLSGSFTLSHDMTVNSLPAGGNYQDRNATDGFFMRFCSTEQGNIKAGTGGGWTILYFYGDDIFICWKATEATPINQFGSPLKLGQTYTFTYDFSHVGDGVGASVNVTITDSSGNVIGSAENLNLRNFSNDAQKSAAINLLQIFNQAKQGSTSSVTLSNFNIQ